MADVSSYISKQTLPIIVTWLDPKHWLTDEGKGNLKITPIGSRETLIAWDHIPNESQVSKIYVQKSESSNEGWYTIGSCSPLDRPQFIDYEGNNTFHRHGVEWYRLLVPEAKTIIGPINSYGYLDAIGSEIARRHLIKLSKGQSGNRCFLFTRMRGTTRCPDCWDKILKKRTKVDCHTCHGTGYLVGYYKPVEVYIHFSPEASNMQTAVDGPSNVEGGAQCWTGNIPYISSGDVVVEEVGNKIWYVDRVDVTTHRRVVTKQNIALTRSTGDDPVWDLVNMLPKEVQNSWVSSQS